MFKGQEEAERAGKMTGQHGVLGEIKPKWFQDFVKGLKKQWPDGLQSRVFVITGTTSGTGFVAAKTVAEMGGKVLLLNRASSRAENSLQALREAVPKGDFIAVECDLQSFASVRKAAEGVRALVKEVDCLACNAGIMAVPIESTTDGFETQMQTNHLSHFLLVKELYPELVAASELRGEARVVLHSSEARKGPPLKKKYFEKDMSVLGNDDQPWYAFGGPRFARYHQSKLANSVFTQGLRDKLKASQSKVKVLVCHPGASFTNLADGMLSNRSVSGPLISIARLIAQSGEDGSMGLLKCMVAKKNENGVCLGNGDFYGPSANFWHMRTSWSGLPNLIKEKEYTIDQVQLLWEASEAAIGESFKFPTAAKL